MISLNEFIKTSLNLWDHKVYMNFFLFFHVMGRGSQSYSIQGDGGSQSDTMIENESGNSLC